MKGALVDAARAKIASGALPTGPRFREWGRTGSGRLCLVCDAPIDVGGMEIEIDVTDRATFIMHPLCRLAWGHALQPR